VSRSGTKDRGAGSPRHLASGIEATECGAAYARHRTTDRTAVTCKRCLASLAKRDREFRRKARRRFAMFDAFSEEGRVP